MTGGGAGLEGANERKKLRKTRGIGEGGIGGEGEGYWFRSTG